MSHCTFVSRCLARIIIGILLVVGAALPAGSTTPEEAGNEGPIVAATEIRIEIHDRAELQDLTRLVDIDDVRGSEVRAHATPTQLSALRAAGYRWESVPTAAKATVVMCPEGWPEDDQRSWSCYPSYDQYTSMMNRWSAAHPDICRLVDLGPGSNTVRPHRLLAIVISDNPAMEEDEPEVLLTSTIHGDETVGFVLMLRLIDHLLEGYALDGDIGELIDSTEIWINPLANPDGTYFAGNASVEGAIRNFTTTSGGESPVNGNRNFPDPEDGQHPDGLPWWPETEAMMALAAAETFVLSANFHGGAEVVNYPWDTWNRRHPDTQWFVDLARDWADLAQADSPGGYLTDRDNGITNGFDWYTISGGRQDFMTYFHGSREVTIELSNTKLVPADEIDDYWQWNRRALTDFIGHAHQGIRGVITDQHGKPLSATIEVLGVDREADGSKVRTDSDVGDFHRLLLPGLYDLEIRADGCVSERSLGVAVIDGEATRLDATLWCNLVRRPTRRVTP